MSKYTDRQKAAFLAVLDANNGNVSGTSKQTGVPRKTLEEWAKGRRLNDDVAEIRQVKKKELCEEFEEIAYKVVGLLPSKLKACNGVQLATIGAIAVDKMQLLKGQPTGITKDVSSHTNEERADRILELVKPRRTGTGG